LFKRLVGLRLGDYIWDLLPSIKTSGRIERDITLAANNTLTVELRSQPGSFIIISITGEVDADRQLITATGTANMSGGVVRLPGGSNAYHSQWGGRT
jgi:predicted LPLAT superfamily acyltransferase